jgi:hypothetical protein
MSLIADSAATSNTDKVPSVNGTAARPPTANADKQTEQSNHPSSERSSTAELGGMLLAFVFGGLGFAARIFWIPALVIMAVVFGLILADRRASKSKSAKGIVPEIVEHVVNEARDIYQAASGTSEGDDDTDKGSHSREDVNGNSTSAHQEAVDLQEHTDRRNGTLNSEDLTTGSVDGLTVNHRSAEPGLTNGTSLQQSPQVEAANEARPEVESAVVETTFVGVDSVVTQSDQADAEETVSSGPEDVELDGGLGELPAPSERSASTTVTSLPLRLFVSVDHLATRNPMVRPVRKRFLGLAQSFSQAVVKMAATPQDESEA